jgi:hypothetical protein
MTRTGASHPVAWREVDASRGLLLRLIPLIAGCLLAACAGTQTPGWQRHAHDAITQYQHAYLEDDPRQAARGYAIARARLAATGRTDLASRLEFIRCATGLAALDASYCGILDSGAAVTSADTLAYARFLRGEWEGLESDALPPGYAPLLKARDESQRAAALAGIASPLSRLVAAGVLQRLGQLPVTSIHVAVDTASEQGWRKPLLAWLALQLTHAQGTGDASAVAAIQSRIALVQTSYRRSGR